MHSTKDRWEGTDVAVNARADALAALAAAGDNPLMRSFPQGAVFTWDEQLRYLSAGGYGLADVGLSREAIEGRTIFEVFPADTVAVIEPLYRAALRGEATTFDVPYEGHVYCQHLAPVFDRAGSIVAGMGFTQDVTHVRAAERALRESEEHSRLSFVHAPIGKALVELDGRWRRVNPALTRLLGYTESELLGLTFQDITHPDDLDADLEKVEHLLAGKIDSYQMEKRYFTATGTTVWVLLAGSLVRNEDGSPSYFIAQIQDITELKRQHEALGNLIAMLAHDLRSPLMAVAGFAELLTAGWHERSDAQKLALVERIGASSGVMGRLLENTLAVSAVDANAVQANPTSVRVDHVVHEALGLLPDAGESVDLTRLAPATAWMDRTHLLQIVTNLVSNAVKYGGGRVTIALEDSAAQVRLRVGDHGPGVPADFVPHLFDRFTRSELARTGRQRGTGLGLYIVRSLLAANDARVSYSETPGGGATFTLDLPRPTAAKGALPSPARRSVRAGAA
ncbi:MAG: PAS domain S-box protein [Sporichthyaceae bacterium]